RASTHGILPRRGMLRPVFDPEGPARASASRVLWLQARRVPSSPWRSLMSVLRSVSKWFRGRGRPAAAVRKLARARLGLESLDARLVPSVFHVTTLADVVAGSLRGAVTQANDHPGADVITFQSGLTGTIALTGGEIDISDDVKINGPGADKLTVSGNNASRIFQVEFGASVNLTGLTIAGGNAGSGNGGGIDNFGALTVSGSVFSGH